MSAFTCVYKGLFIHYFVLFYFLVLFLLGRFDFSTISFIKSDANAPQNIPHLTQNTLLKTRGCIELKLGDFRSQYSTEQKSYAILPKIAKLMFCTTVRGTWKPWEMLPLLFHQTRLLCRDNLVDVFKLMEDLHLD